LRLVGGEFQVRYTFMCEQEYVLHVEFLSSDTEGESKAVQVGEFRIYALEDDLFTRRPYKGDLHIHSRRSDGQESPAYVAGACRRIGLDFMAVTDHRRYEPSLEAMEAYQDVDTDLRIYPGEEVHRPTTRCISSTLAAVLASTPSHGGQKSGLLSGCKR
jgi:hypothetical protein